MKTKRIMSAAIAAIMVGGAISAGALEIKSSSEDVKVYYDNKDVYAYSDNKPVIINERTMVPLRPIFEAMGWENEQIEWYAEEKKALFQGGDTSCTFVNDSTTAIRYWSDGTVEEIQLDVPATIYNGNFYIPLRAYCELWGNDITWNDNTRSVYITNSDDSTGTNRIYVSNKSNTNVVPESESKKITEEEAEAKIKEWKGDLGSWVDGENNVLVCDGLYTCDGKEYYQFRLRGMVNGHLTTLTYYVVSADGTEVFDGKCSEGKVERW